MSAGGRRYCTYFDSQYLARGITMLRSLRRWDPDASLLVLALDEVCATVVEEVFGDRIEVLRQRELLAANPDLESCRGRRSDWAYYAMHKPVLLLAALMSASPGAPVVFIDADTWFFSEPQPMLAGLTNASIGLSPHRFCEGNDHLSRYGLYNAGFIYFQANEHAFRCVADWRADCLEWCEEEPLADGRFMNQGYLNRWPGRYAGVRIVQHPGLNLAPWNINGHRLERHGDNVLVDGEPLIFYHFSATHSDAEGNWYSLANYFEKQFELVIDAIYEPYARAVEAESEYLMKTHGIESCGSVRSVTIGRGAVRVYPRPLLSKLAV